MKYVDIHLTLKLSKLNCVSFLIRHHLFYVRHLSLLHYATTLNYVYLNTSHQKAIAQKRDIIELCPSLHFPNVLLAIGCVSSKSYFDYN
jgi:hypothetical protein